MTTAVETYRLVFRGELVAGVALEDVKANAARLLKLADEQVAQLLSGRNATLKRGLQHAELARYQQVLARAGLVVHAEAEQEALAFPSLTPHVEPEPAPVPTPVAAPAPAVPVLDLTPQEATPVDDFGGALAPLSAVRKPSASMQLDATMPAAADAEPQLAMLAPVEDEVVCPKCQLRQAKRTLCRGCGVDMPRFRHMAEVAVRDAYTPPSSSLRGSVNDNLREPWCTELWSLSLSGRIGRLRYLAWLLPVTLAAVLVAIFATLVGVSAHGANANFARGLLMVTLLGLFCYPIRLMVLRLHDMGFSGKFALLMIVPVVGQLMALALLLMPGQRSANDYGPEPDENSIGVIVGALLVFVVCAWGVRETTHLQRPAPVPQLETGT